MLGSPEVGVNMGIHTNVSPNDPGKGYHFDNKIVGGVIPREYIPSVDAGIKEALKTGVLLVTLWKTFE